MMTIQETQQSNDSFRTHNRIIRSLDRRERNQAYHRDHKQEDYRRVNAQQQPSKARIRCVRTPIDLRNLPRLSHHVFHRERVHPSIADPSVRHTDRQRQYQVHNHMESDVRRQDINTPPGELGLLQVDC